MVHMAEDLNMAYTKENYFIIEMARRNPDTLERPKWCDDDDGDDHHTEFHYDLFVIARLWELVGATTHTHIEIARHMSHDVS